MFYRVMSFDGEVRDFETETEAHIFYLAKRKIAERAPIPIDARAMRPSVNIHRCYHDETPTRPCKIIEKYTK